MLKIETKTKLSSEDTINRAVEFSDSNGLGLKVTAQSANCASFEGGGGGIEITTCIEEKKTSVDLESREWDYRAKEFIEKIGRLHSKSG